MSKKSNRRRVSDPDNPEWTAADFKRARPAIEVVPNIVKAYLARRGRPPKGDASKTQVTLRLDPAIVAHYKRTGAGRQTRINDALREKIAKTGGRKRQSAKS